MCFIGEKYRPTFVPAGQRSASSSELGLVMSTHSLKEEYELCRVGNRSHEHFKLKVDDTYVHNLSQVVSAWNPVRKYSAGMSTLNTTLGRVA